jgi:hypothetical protein
MAPQHHGRFLLEAMSLKPLEELQFLPKMMRLNHIRASTCLLNTLRTLKMPEFNSRSVPSWAKKEI